MECVTGSKKAIHKMFTAVTVKVTPVYGESLPD